MDARAAGQRVVQALHHQHAGALAHDEAVAALVPGLGGALGVLVVGAERAARHEAAQPHGDDGCLRAARHDHVRVAAQDVVRGRVEAVVGGGAGGGDGVIGAHEARLDAEERAAHVGDGKGDEEGGDLLGALLHQVLHAVLEHLDASHAGADQHAALDLVQLLERLGAHLQARVDQGLLAAHHCVLEAVIIAALALPVDEALAIEVLDLPGKLGGELRCVKAVDHVDTALASEQLVVEGVNVVTEDGADTHTGDDNALAGVLSGTAHSHDTLGGNGHARLGGEHGAAPRGGGLALCKASGGHRGNLHGDHFCLWKCG
mmetsp:Transcript_20756/g.45485  ORF Transcript_20756/g.45485 Transcript_20756/m.45485 type:complete len:317 (+) Transcript_20756:689-1639(+)